MKRQLLIGLSTAAMLAMASMSAFAEGAVQTQDGLLEITLPEGKWYQMTSAENTAMFSDGDCAIIVNLYKNGETLPPIQSADANHELIYTAAASNQQYILHVVGYAHAQEDFSGICKAINTIKVDNTKITDSMLNHAIQTDEYSIAEMNYTAWVDTDELNVRSTSVDGSIITTLQYGDTVTVTGSVIRNSMEMGWVRVVTADGTEGYVSSQFLTTIATTKEDAPKADENAQHNGTYITLYNDAGESINLLVYTDGTVRTEDGVAYCKSINGVYVDGNGNSLYTQDPTEGLFRTGSVFTVYDMYGNPCNVYQYSDFRYYDDSFNVYDKIWGTDEWAVNGGQWTVSLVNPAESQPQTQVEVEFDPNSQFLVEADNGFRTYLNYDPESNCWYDETGAAYDRYNAYGAFIDQNGLIVYDKPTFE